VIEDALVELLTPLVRRLVKAELAKERDLFRWAPVPVVASKLGISEEAVRRRWQKGHLPGRVVERRVYIDLVALDREIDATLS
jgi:hypothetical protein